LSNLIDNAIRYGDDKSPIMIEMDYVVQPNSPQQVGIRISNRPALAGWPDPQQIFKKYYRSAGAKKESGTGLGLYLIQTLAHTIGAHCDYVPTPEKVQFELWIPI
jgi:K+-sensing histidine kinase KdpD